jgi:hypothetical protein
MVSVENFHRSARARPPPADTPDEASAVATSQVTHSIHDFAVSLRTRAVKKQFLSDIAIYRMVGNDLQTFQLKYQPADFQRRRRG